MKLLLDEQPSPRLVATLQGAFSGTSHVHSVGLGSADDRDIWQFARDHQFVIVTKDADFLDLAMAWGQPPKVVWLRTGNESTAAVAEALLRSVADIEHLVEDAELAVLSIG